MSYLNANNGRQSASIPDSVLQIREDGLSSEPVLQRVYIRGEAIFLTPSLVQQIEDGDCSPDLQKVRRYIFPHVVSAALAFNDSAKNSESVEIKRVNTVKALLDENLSGELLPYVWDHLGDAVRVNHMGLRRSPDSKVFDRAIKHGFNAIITTDMAMGDGAEDLTAIACKRFTETREAPRRMRNEAPVIVQLDVKRQKPETFREIFFNYGREIGQYVIDKRSPFIRVSLQDGLVDGRALYNI